MSLSPTTSTSELGDEFSHYLVTRQAQGSIPQTLHIPTPSHLCGTLIKIAMSVRPSVRTHITTRKPTIDTTLYFIMEYFKRNCPAFQFWIKSIKHDEHRLPNVQRPTNNPTRRTKGSTNYAPTAFTRGLFRLYYTVFYRNMPLILQSSSVTYTRQTANLSLR